MLCFSNGPSDRRTGRRPIKVLTPPHLANAFVWNLRVIQQSWQLAVKWRVTGVRAWRLYYSCVRSQSCGGSGDLTEYNSVCLKVNRSEGVPDPLTHRSLLTSLSIACAHDKGSADSWRRIKEQAAPLMTWELSFLNCVVKWWLLLWFHTCIWSLNVLCK